MELSQSPVILITGASSGIGAAAARHFCQRGWRAVLAARRQDRLEELVAEIRADGGEALAVATDVTVVEQLQRLVDAALEHYGRIDVLFNNAGFGRLDWLEKLDIQEDIAAQIAVNLTACVQLTGLVLPHMIARRRGVVINMSSLAGWVGTPTYSVYAASKFGLRGFTEALRREVGVFGVKVCGIYPGGVDTEIAEKAHIRRRTGLTTPGWLRLEADDVARAVWSLAHRPRRALILPRLMLLAVWANSLFPGLFDWIAERGFVRRERNSRGEASG
jgi:NADP-dependent 3-hydroxy acid dehydrogenase YdfG